MRTIVGPPAKRHLNAFHWRANDGPTLNAGLVALCFVRGSRPVLLRTPIFCDVSGRESGPPLPTPSGSAHVSYLNVNMFVCVFL